MEDDLKLIIALMCMKETRLALSFTSKFWIFSCCTPKINPSLLSQKKKKKTISKSPKLS